MIRKERCIVIDLDGTLCGPKAGKDYGNETPNRAVIDTLKRYKEQGFHIIIATSRNMRTHDGNVGLINKETLPIIVDWLRKHDVPYDEIHVGKPWQGYGGFYVDDKTIRPDEFVTKSYEDILRIVNDADQPGQ
jgi:capsule biosynthesis phosphatase